MSDDIFFDDEEQQEETPHLSVGISTASDYTKVGLEVMAHDLMSKYREDGTGDPMEMYVNLKALQEMIGSCIEDIKEDALEELEKYGKEVVKRHGVPLIIKSSARKYSFDHYEEWCALDEKIKDIAEKKKALESTMKTCVGTGGVLDDDTGEITPPAVIVSEGKTILQASIPKK